MLLRIVMALSVFAIGPWAAPKSADLISDLLT